MGISLIEEPSLNSGSFKGRPAPEMIKSALSLNALTYLHIYIAILIVEILLLVINILILIAKRSCEIR